MSGNWWMEDPRVRKWSREFPGMQILPPPVGSSEHASILDSIRADEQSILSLGMQIELLQCEMAKKKALATPARAIPLEILSRIFTVEQYWYPNDAVALLRISRVSRQWRKAAMGTPELWSKIQLGLSGKHAPKSSAKDLKNWLARAKAIPLTVMLNEEVIVPAPMQKIMFSNAGNIETIGHLGESWTRRGDRPTKLSFYCDLLKCSRNLKCLKDCPRIVSNENIEIPSLSVLTIRTEEFCIKAPNVETFNVNVSWIRNIDTLLQRIQERSPNLTSLIFNQNCSSPYDSESKMSLCFAKLQTLECQDIGICAAILRGSGQTLRDLRMPSIALNSKFPSFPLVHQLLLFRETVSQLDDEGLLSREKVEQSFRRFPSLTSLAFQVPYEMRLEPDNAQYLDWDMQLQRILEHICEFDQVLIPRLKEIKLVRNSWETVVSSWPMYDSEVPGQVRPAYRNETPTLVEALLEKATRWPRRIQ